MNIVATSAQKDWPQGATIHPKGLSINQTSATFTLLAEMQKRPFPMCDHGKATSALEIYVKNILIGQEVIVSNMLYSNFSAKLGHP